MWKIRKFSLQSGLELKTTRMIDEVITNCPIFKVEFIIIIFVFIKAIKQCRVTRLTIATLTLHQALNKCIRPQK